MDKSKLMMTIIIALLVLLLGTVIGVTVFLINLVGDDTASQFEDPLPPPPPHNLNMMDLHEIVLGDSFITNLAGPGFATAQFGVALGIDNTGDVAEFNTFISDFGERINLARGIVNSVFQTLTYEEVRSPEGQTMAQERIKIELQNAFATNLIIVVSFTDWFIVRR